MGWVTSGDERSGLEKSSGVWCGRPSCERKAGTTQFSLRNAPRGFVVSALHTDGDGLCLSRDVRDLESSRVLLWADSVRALGVEAVFEEKEGFVTGSGAGMSSQDSLASKNSSPSSGSAWKLMTGLRGMRRKGYGGGLWLVLSKADI